MKILIPNYCVPDSFVDNVADTLSYMGHEVQHMGPKPPSALASPLRRVIKEYQRKVFRTHSEQERWLLKKCKSERADIVLSLTQSLDEEVLFEVRKTGAKTISWWGDPSANMNEKGLCHREWDLIFIKDHYAAFKLKSLGLPAFQLYEAMNPRWHMPVFEQRNSQVVIAGTFYDYRHYLTIRLIEHKVDLGLYGGRLPIWADQRIKHIHTGRYVTKGEKSRIFGEALAVLNSTSMKEFASLNCRAFEIAGCGGLQFLESRPRVEECFEPGKELLMFESIEELLALIERAKEAPAEMQQIRKAGARRAAEHHTYEVRLQTILKRYKEL